MTGQRKIVTCALGLGAILVLGFMSSYGGLPTEALTSLNWGVVMLTGTALGANVGEWYMKRPVSSASPKGAKGAAEPEAM